MTDPRLLWDHAQRTGRIICVICCDDFPPDELEPVSDEPGQKWDVCQGCAAREKTRGANY